MIAAVFLGTPIAIAGVAYLYYSSSVTTDESISGSALISANERTISVTAAGSCDDTINLSADEQPTGVALTLHYTHPRIPPCSGMPGFAVYDVHLSAPLGQRHLLDGLTGARIPFFNVAGIARPAYLPAGYMFRYNAPDASDLLTYQNLQIPRDARCSQIYAHGYDLLVITQGGTLIMPPRAKPKQITVNGHPALEFPSAVSWTERGQRLTVSSEDLPDSELIAVAMSMRA